jgi:hypothetical protein
MKVNCPECLGKGYNGIAYYSEKYYKIVCSKCLGKRKLDWIEIITTPKFEMITLNINLIMNNLPPSNYLLKMPGIIYFIQKEFFKPHLSYNEQFNYLSMIRSK